MEATDFNRLERKLDLIIDALGLSDKRKLAPCQIKEMVKNDVLKFQQKRRIKNGYDHKES